MPMFHVNTWHGNVDYVKAHNITNIFEGDPTELSYGTGIVAVIYDADRRRQVHAARQDGLRRHLERPVQPEHRQELPDGDQEARLEGGQGFEQFTAPQANWGGVLVKIRDANPDVIVFSDYAAGDEAAFIKQFASSPTKSLVYQQYAPSIPQYLQLAGDSANGVIWSTVVGILQNDPVAQPFIDSFTQKFGSGPGFSNAGDQYDLVKIWAQAVGAVGDPYDFDKINAYVKATPYRGVCGAYYFNNPGSTCIAYPDDTLDPSIGMPHLTFQIQNGKQVPISPAPVRDRQVPDSASGCKRNPGGGARNRSSRSRDRRSSTAGCAPSTTCRSRSPRGRCSASPGPTARARRRCSTRSRATRSRPPARSYLAGESIRGTKIHHRCRLGLARTFQQPVAADTLTALENAYLAASFRRGRTGRRSRAADVAAGEAALALVGLEHRAIDRGLARCPCTTRSG